MEDKLERIESQIGKLLTIQELLVSSMDRTLISGFDISQFAQMTSIDLKKLREKLLENGIMSRIESMAVEVKEIHIKHDKLLENQDIKYNKVIENQEKLLRSLSGLFTKIIVALITASITGLTAIGVTVITLSLGR